MQEYYRTPLSLDRPEPFFFNTFMHKRFHQHSFVNLFLILFGCVTFFLAGCSDSGMGMDKSVYASADMPGEAFAEKNIESNDSLGGETGEDGSSGIASELPGTADRKIIYVTEIRLVLKETSFEDFEKDIAKLIKDNSAYQSEVTFNRNRGERRTGRWVVRVPVDLYQAFLVGIKDLGVPEEVQESAMMSRRSMWTLWHVLPTRSGWNNESLACWTRYRERFRMYWRLRSNWRVSVKRLSDSRGRCAISRTGCP